MLKYNRPTWRPSRQAFASRSPRVLLLNLCALSAAACQPADYECADVAREVVAISESSDEVADLVKIKFGRAVLQDERELRCEGTGVFVTGDEAHVIYRVYKDDDDELMFEFYESEGEQ